MSDMLSAVLLVTVVLAVLLVPLSSAMLMYTHTVTQYHNDTVPQYHSTTVHSTQYTTQPHWVYVYGIVWSSMHTCEHVLTYYVYCSTVLCSVYCVTVVCGTVVLCTVVLYNCTNHSEQPHLSMLLLTACTQTDAYDVYNMQTCYI